MPKATITEKVQAPSDRIAELLRTCLAGAGWRIEFINEELCELTALQNKSERIKGVQWNYEYRCLASWQPQDDAITVVIEISENRNQWSLEQCKAQCIELMQGMVSKAAKLAIADKARPQRTRYGSARWGNHEDLVKAGYWGGYDDSRRLVCSPGFDDNYVTMTPEDSIKHAVACGPTGSGKTTAVFVPNLCTRLQSSAIVTEATAGNDPPDLYYKTSGYRFLAGRQRIYYFNPDDLSSYRINPIDSVDSYAKAQQLAQLVIENTTSKNNYGDDVWPKSEANLLAILIAHAAAEKQHLGYIRALLREGPDGLLPIMSNSKVEIARSEYKGFCNTARDGFKYGVFAGLMQRLGLWVNPRIIALTEKTDIDIADLKNQLFTFYLATPAQKTHLKPVAALIFNFILEQALDQHFKQPLYLSLDEFTNFGYIPGIVEKLSIIRHKKIGVMIGFQGFYQLVKVYGKEDSNNLFSQPGTKFFFRTRDLETAEKVSKMVGQTTIFERKMTSSGQIQERESGRPLIDPGEVLALDDKEMILFTPTTPPLKIPRFTYEDNLDAMSIPPILKPEIVIDESLVQACEELKKRQEWEKKGEAARKEEMGENKPGHTSKPKTESGAPKQNRDRFKKRPQQPKREPEPEPKRQQGPQIQEPERGGDDDVSYH